MTGVHRIVVGLTGAHRVVAGLTGVRGDTAQAHAVVAAAVGSTAPAGGLVSLGAGAVFDAAGQWVAAGASWILAQVVEVVSATTTPPIGTAWFTARLDLVAAVAATLVVPMACCAAVQAVLRQSPGMALRTMAVHLPVAVGFTGTAVALVQMALAVTDTLSQQILSSAGTTVGGTLSPLSRTFAAPAVVGAPSFVLLLGAVVVVVAGLALWLEMAVRSAAVSVAVLFLPLVMAALVWPAVSVWCRRLADTLVALILSKLVIVAALGVATAALGEGAAGSSATGGFGAVVTGAALLVVASAAPFTLLRLVPAIEAGATAQLEQARHHVRRAMGQPRRTMAWAASMAATAGVGGVDPATLVGSIGGGADPGGGGTGGGGTGGGIGGADPGSGVGDSGGGTGGADPGGGGDGGGAGGAHGGAGGGAGRGGTAGFGTAGEGGDGAGSGRRSGFGRDTGGGDRSSGGTAAHGGRTDSAGSSPPEPSSGRRRARTWAVAHVAVPGRAPLVGPEPVAAAPTVSSSPGDLRITQPSEDQLQEQREKLQAEMQSHASADPGKWVAGGSVGAGGADRGSGGDTGGTGPGSVVGAASAATGIEDAGTRIGTGSGSAGTGSGDGSGAYEVGGSYQGGAHGG